jgi:protocatechuate 3,4-dioxygenase alpha subunit
VSESARRDDAPLIASASQTVGPFFHFGLATNEALGTVAPADAAGERVRLRVRVLDGDGVAVPDALIEIYQADATGVYATGFSGFGRLPTGEDGVCVFETIRPGAVQGGHAPRQASHINVCLFARGLLRHLMTRIYFAGDADQASDPLLSLVAPDRRETLMAVPLEREPGTWEFTIRLQGDRETVFFDF